MSLFGPKWKKNLDRKAIKYLTKIRKNKEINPYMVELCSNWTFLAKSALIEVVGNIVEGKKIVREGYDFEGFKTKISSLSEEDVEYAIKLVLMTKIILFCERIEEVQFKTDVFKTLNFSVAEVNEYETLCKEREKDYPTAMFKHDSKILENLHLRECSKDSIVVLFVSNILSLWGEMFVETFKIIGNKYK